LVRAIMADKSGPFTTRALTRDPKSDKAKALADLGAEVVQADVDDAASLARAFQGAHGAYCVTFFWAHMQPEKELAEARNMAQAAKQAKVAHVVWSTLEDTRKLVPLTDNRMPTLGGKYKVPHFDAKGEADAIFTELGVPTTFLVTSFYWDNFIYFGMGPKKGPDGKLAITLPTGAAKLPGIAAEDIGKWRMASSGGEGDDRKPSVAAAPDLCGWPRRSPGASSQSVTTSHTGSLSGFRFPGRIMATCCLPRFVESAGCATDVSLSSIQAQTFESGSRRTGRCRSTSLGDALPSGPDDWEETNRCAIGRVQRSLDRYLRIPTAT
jgi:uncharacterized protein YbjT (DUF2867 family)